VDVCRLFGYFNLPHHDIGVDIGVAFIMVDLPVVEIIFI